MKHVTVDQLLAKRQELQQQWRDQRMKIDAIFPNAIAVVDQLIEEAEEEKEDEQEKTD